MPETGYHGEFSDYPLPVLLMLSEDNRDVVSNRFSVTELLNPIQSTLLHRLTDYTTHPDDSLYATMGTAWHEKVERQRERCNERWPGRFLFENENKLRHTIPTEYGEAILTGIPDLYDTEKDILWDFKTAFYEWQLHYILKNGWDGQTHWHWQVNMYRVWKYPQAKDMKVFAFIKDWKRRLKLKYDIERKMILDVPWIDDEEIQQFTVDRLTQLMGIQDGALPMPPCPEEELWIHPKDGRRARCEDYCYINHLCPQYKEYKDEQTGSV